MRDPKCSIFGIGAIILDCLFTIEAIVNICTGKGTTFDFVLLLLFVFVVILLICERIVKK